MKKTKLIHDMNLVFPACVVKEKELYSITDVEKIFMKIDIESGKVNYIDNPHGYIPSKWTGTDGILYNDGKLYCFEQNGERVMECLLNENKCRYIDIHCNKYVCSNFASYIIYENKLYIFPSFLHKVIKIDLTLGNIEKEEEFCTEIEYIYEKEGYDGFGAQIPCKLFSCGCQVGCSMWLFTEKSQRVIEFNLKTEKYMVYEIPKEIKGCIHAIYKDNLFYILSIEGNVYSWNSRENTICEVVKFECDMRYPYFGKIVVTNNKVWMLPNFGQDIWVKNTKTGELIKYSNYPNEFNYHNLSGWSKYYTCTEDCENYYFSMHVANYILSIQKETGDERWIKPIVPPLKEKYEFYKKNKWGVIDERGGSLMSFINSLDFELNRDEDKEKMIGCNFIWKNIK